MCSYYVVTCYEEEFSLGVIANESFKISYDKVRYMFCDNLFSVIDTTLWGEKVIKLTL